jgi:alpha-beta hydrolase superfamily lysophospholipase
MPTLVIWGGCDYVLPAHHAQAAVRLLPQGRLSMLPHCGHLPHVEQPARFAAVLGDWLTEHREQQPQSSPSTATELGDHGQRHLVTNPYRRTA